VRRGSFLKAVYISSEAHEALTKATGLQGKSMSETASIVIERALQQKNLRVADASRIFRAMQGDKDSQERTTIEEVSGYIHSDTFAGWRAINNIVLLEGE